VGIEVCENYYYFWHVAPDPRLRPKNYGGLATPVPLVGSVPLSAIIQLKAWDNGLSAILQYKTQQWHRRRHNVRRVSDLRGQHVF
jgi:hypothetical protein